MVKKIAAAAGGVIVLAASVVGLLSNTDDGHPENDPGSGWLPLATSAAHIKDEIRGVALPTQRPADLTALSGATTGNEHQVSFATSGQNVMICQADDIAETSCGFEGATVIKEQVATNGQTWQVVLMPDDVQNGTGDPTATIEWWSSVTYDTKTPDWIADLAVTPVA